MVGKRRALLAYLKDTDIESYRNLIGTLYEPRLKKVINQGGVYNSALLRC